MTNVWVVRAEFGKYASDFLSEGYIGIGWLADEDLSAVTDRDQLYPIYRRVYPQEASTVVIGQQVGQIARFLLEIKGGDYVITPTDDTEKLNFGMVHADPSYYYEGGSDGCWYPHRRKVDWEDRQLIRSEFSVPFQYTMGSSLTIFSVSHRTEFLRKIGASGLLPKPDAPETDPNQIVLDQILELDSQEFEILVGHLLTALGFEGSEITGKSGDGGVDATGELNASNLAKVKIFVQAKRYSRGAKVSSNVVRSLRQTIPNNGQGAFITTADFQAGAADVANEPGFPRIDLINGTHLVELLIENWDNIPKEFQDLLGLKRGLVLI